MDRQRRPQSRLSGSVRGITLMTLLGMTVLLAGWLLATFMAWVMA